MLILESSVSSPQTWLALLFYLGTSRIAWLITSWIAFLQANNYQLDVHNHINSGAKPLGRDCWIFCLLQGQQVAQWVLGSSIFLVFLKH